MFGIVSFLVSIAGAICGIGGGPINLVVLYYFFSMETKIAAANSLYIILFGQITSLISTLVTNTVPDFSCTSLAVMITGSIRGNVVGRRINRKSTAWRRKRCSWV